MMAQIKSDVTAPILMVILILSCLGLTACGAVVAGAGVAAVAAGTTEKGFGTSVSDGIIRAKLNDSFIGSNADLFINVTTSVNAGSVLLTGNVDSPEEKVQATHLAWQVKGVVEVVNEITVKDTSSITDIAKDLAAAAELRTKLIGDREISSINFSIDVVNGTVFLSGIASSEQEANLVVDHARSLNFATEVKNYIRISTDDRQ